MGLRSAFKRKSSRILTGALAIAGAVIGAAVAFAGDPGVSSRIDYAMTFNGSDTYLRTESQVLPASGSFTVESFIKIDPGQSNFGWVWSTGTPTDAAKNWGVIVGDGDASSGMVLQPVTPDGYQNGSYFRVPVNEWLHITLTYDSTTTTYYFYVNGTQVDSRYVSSPTPAAGLSVGRGRTATEVPYGAANSYFKGQIDEVKVFNTVRTSAQMLTDTRTYLASNTSGLLAEYDFNEGSTGFGTIYDRTVNNYDLTVNGTAAFTDIAQYTNTSRTTNVVRFNRSYLTQAGGWYSPGGVTSIQGYVYGGGGGGGGGAWETVGAGGGGGGAGQRISTNNSTASNSLITVQVGVGGVGGGPSWNQNVAGLNGNAGQASKFNATTAAGGSGGYGGGLAAGTATYSAGVGGKGAASGNGYSGSTMTGADGGAGAGFGANAAANTRLAVAGATDTYAVGETFVKGGDGGVAYASQNNYTSYDGANGAPASGSGGGGGGGSSTSTVISKPGGAGASGTIIVYYSINTTTQDNDYLYTFSGSGQWAESAPNATALNVSGDFTLEAWVNPTNTCASAYCTIAGRDNNYILATSNGTYWWRIANSNSGSAWFNTGVPLVVGQWQHVALVRSGASVLLYVNGQLMSTQANGDTDASGTTISLTSTSTPGLGFFAIAARGVDHVDLFAGGIDEVRLWSVVRTATEIGDPSTGDFNRPLNTTELASASLLGYWDMNDTVGTKLFMNRKTGASPTTDLGLVGLPTYAANGASTGVNTRYLTLNSTYNTVAYTPDSPSYELTGSTFTISGWWYVTACSNNYLVSKANTYSIALDSACKINVQLDPGNEGAAQTWQWMNTGYAVTKSVWHYVSAIKNGTTLFVYVDGNLVSTINNGDSVQTFNSTGNITAVVPANLGDRNTYFGIGSTGVGATRSSVTTENIDDIRLWNTDRSTKQALDMAGFVPHTQTGLQALFDFNALLSTSVPVPNLASAGASDPLLTVTSTMISTVAGAATPVPGQPSRQIVYLNRSVIKSSTQLGAIPTNYTSAEYWLMGGGGGGGTGGNSGYTGAGGGAGGLVEGTVTGLTTGVSSETVTTMKVGVGGRYGINNGDSVQSGATNGTPTVFAATGFTQTAAGGGAGGSGTTNPAIAPQGLAGGSGGGSAQTGGAGGAATQGYAGGAGSASASGGGGGAKSAGSDASGGAGGSGGKGFVNPYYGLTAPTYVGAGGSGNGTTSAGTANSAFGATAAATDAAAGSGSGGGGAGFTSASTGTSRGGYGGAGFIYMNSFAGHPFADSGPTTFWSGKPSSTPLVVSIRDINGDLISTATGTVSLTVITSGCNAQGTYTGTVSGGRTTIPNITIYSNAVQVCQINLSYNAGGTGAIFVPTQTAPASIVVNTSATTAGCSFVQGAFVCPYTTAANLNVNDLIAQLNTNDVLLSTTGGDITINSPITGTTGALSMAAYGTVRLNAGIALSGLNKALTIQTLNHIIGNESATSGSPTAFSTNGGAIYFYTMMTSNASAGYVKLSNYNTFTTNGGAFTISGGPDPTTGYASGSTAAQTTDITANGIYFATGATVNTGAGDVSLRGKLQGSNTILYTPGTAGITWPAGVSMQPSSAITTTSGAVSILGNNPGFNFDNTYRTGVKLDTATITTGSGAINITGVSTDAGSNVTAGIYSAGMQVTSNSGNIAVSGAAPTNATAPISFATAESTFGSTTGDVSLSSGNTYLNSEKLDFLRLTGGGNHTLTFPMVTFNTVTNGLNAVGSGNLTITTPTGMAFNSTVTVPPIANFGTSYKNITISDNATSSSTVAVTMNANLTASNSVLLRAAQISGSGSVTAPGLAMVARNTGAAYINQLTGASDVDTLALTHGSSAPTAGMGITDADGWTPGTVAGVVGVYGVAKSISSVTPPSSNVTKGQVLPQQPVVKLVDAYGLTLTSSNLTLANYTMTPSISSGTPTTAITPTTPVSFNSSGQSTFSGLKFTSSGLFTLAYTVSPALTGTSTLSGGVTVASSTSPATISASPATINATSNTAFSASATYLDPYGNPSGTATGGYMPSVALTSMPSGVLASALTGNFSAASNGVSSSSNLKINGPTGTYVITITSTYPGITTQTSTVTINLTGWSLDYGGSSLPYKTTTYAPNFVGNGTGAVTYSSSTTAVCTVNSSTGAVQPVQPGTCTISATQAADANYGTGTATATFTITKGTQATVTLAASPPTLVYGSSVLLVGAGGNGGSFTYTKVSGNCTLTTATLASGTANAGDVCVVNATRAGDVYWNAATSADYSFTVAGMAQSAVVPATGKNVPYNTATDLTLSPYTPTGGSGTGAWQFSTVTPNCSINGNLLTSTVAVGGTCDISVVKAASGNYAASTAVTMRVTISKGTQTIGYVTVASSVRVGDSVTVSATSSSGLTVSYAIASGSNAYCSLSNGSTVTFTSPGTCVINATQAGDSNYNAASVQTLTYTVAKGIQTITFSPMTDDVVRTTTRTAVATASSGLAVTFSVGGATTNSACTVTSGGAISLNAVGLCQITASQSGNTNYDAATDVSVSFLVGQGTQSALVITNATSVAYGNTLALTATGGNGSSSYTWSATGDCTVNGSTLSVGNAGGNCVVSVDRPGDANWYAATTASQTITINKANQATIAVSASSSVVYGNTLMLNYSGGSGTGAVTYATTGTCTESNGVLTVGNAGSSCAVTVTKDSDSNYNAATSASFTVTITRAQQAAVTITSNSTVVYGNTLTLAASGGTGGGSISYSTTGTCSVANGVLTVGNVGSSCTVTATRAQSTNYSAESSSPMTITIVKADQTITITSTANSPTALGSYVISATADSGLAVDFSIDPSTSSACFVSGSAVTFVTSGDCLILAYQAGNNNYNAAPLQSQLVTAGLASQSIIFNSPGTKHYGDSPFAAGATIGSGLTISYSLGGATTNNSCSVDAQGNITIQDVGTCQILADQAGDNVFDAAPQASVTFTIARGNQTALTISSASTVVYGNTISLTTSGGSSTGAVTYATTGTCTESNGVLTVGNAGSTCTVTATQAGDSQYVAVSSNAQTITITKASQSISFISLPSTPTALGNYSVIATSSSGVTVTFTIAANSASVCSVSGTTVSFLTSGSCEILADQAGNTNYDAAPQATQIVTVGKADQTITIPDPGTMHVGDASFNAGATSDSSLHIAYSLGSATTNNACSITSSGVINIAYAGDCEIVADQAGDVTYNPAVTARLTFAIAAGPQATLTISSASTVTYGNTISLTTSGGSGTGAVTYATTGTCSVSGTTLTVGDAGSSCSVTATKAADANYTAASSTAQTVTITRASQATLSVSSASTVVYGNTITLATSGGSGNGVVSYATTGTCSEANGILTVGDAGSTCTVTATKAQSTNYNSTTSVAQTVTITREQQTISFVSTPNNEVALGTYTVNATSSSGLTVTVTVDASAASVCSISGNTVSLLTSGSCVLNADQAGNTNYSAATQAQQIFSVGKAAQTISFTAPGNHNFGDSSFAIQASASSNLTVAFTLGGATTNSACSVDSAGNVTIADVGTCEVLADQAGNGVYAAAPQQSIVFQIGKGTQAALTVSSASTVIYGNTISLTTSGGSGTGAVTYATTGTCSVSGTTLTVGDAGSSCSVTATKAADSQFVAATSSAQTVTITKSNQTITISATGSTPTALGSNTLAGIATSGLTVDLTVDASTSANCSISGNTLNFLRSGSCLINADQAGNTNYNAAPQAQSTFTIAKSAQTISITNPGSVRYGDATFQIAATATSGLAIAYSTGTNTTNSACSIDSAGNVTINDVGACEVTANQAGDAVYEAATATSLTFQVAKGAQATLAISSANSVAYGNTISLTTIGGSGQGSVNYTTTGTCSVSGSTLTVGVVGSACTVTATKAADAQYESISSAAQTVTIVRASQPTLSISSASTVAYGNTITLTVSGGAGDGAVTYATTGTCSEANGILTVGNAGSACTVTATKAQSANYNSTTSATQTITVDKANQQPLVITSATSGTYGDLILPTVSGGSGTGAVSYIVGGQGCMPSQSQLALVAAGRPCSLTAVKAASANYNSETSSTVSITVNKANQVITVTSTPTNPQALGYYNPSFSADSGLNVTFSIDASSSSVCQVRLASVEFLTSGTCLVNFDQAGDPNHNAAPQVQQSISVATTAQTISFPAISTKHYLDAAFQAQASSDSGLAISYSLGVHTTNNSCSVTSSGLISILDTGFCEIYADQAGNNIYSAASMVSQNFSIDRAAQAAVTLTNASTVTYGNTLTLTAAGGSGTGAFSYTVDSGTCSLSGAVLTVGNAGSLCTVYATRARDSQFADEASAIMTITVTRATQAAFSISSASSVAFGGTINLATSGGSGNGAVTYATTGTCSESNGVLTVGHAGSSCTVTATKAQSTNYNAATSATQTVNITKANQTVSFTSTPSSPTALGSYSVAASSDSGLTVAITVDSGSTSVCSISGATVSFLTGGSCVLNANQSGDNDFNAATQVQQNITVAKASQSISLTNPGTHYFGDTAFSITGSATSSLAIAYSLGSGTTNSACSVASNGTVTVAHVGTCEILADQAGNATYSAATQTSIAFSIAKATQAAFTISSASSVSFGSTISLTVSGGSGSGAVTYATAGTCTESNGVLTVGDAGSSCTVTATKAADSDYNAATTSAQTITVTRATQAAFSISSASSVAFGGTINLATSGGSGNGAVTYATTGTCSESNGVLTVGHAGSSCTVTATKAQSTNYSAATSATQTVTVTKANQTVSITSTPSSPTALGTYTVAGSATSGLTVAFTIDASATAVCSVSGTTVSFIKSGSCVINADQAGDNDYNAATQVQQIFSVAKKHQMTHIGSISDKAFGDAAFYATGSADSGLAVVWSTGPGTTNSACSIDSNTGLVTVLNNGACNIIVDQPGDDVWAPATSSGVMFNIGQGNQATLTMYSASTVVFGGSINLATSGGSGTGTVTYAVTGTCTLQGSTLIPGDAGSACSVTATKAADARFFAASSAAQTITVTRANQAALSITSASSAYFGNTISLTVTGGSGNGSISYATTGTCTEAGGVLTPGAVGSNCTVTATKAASTNYNAVSSAAQTVQVLQTAQTISFTSTASSPTALGSYTVAATATSGLSVSFAIDSASASVCSISGSTVSFLTGGSCVINATQSGNSNFGAAQQVQQTITVAKKAQNIQIASPADRNVGDPAFTLGVSLDSGRTLTYYVDSNSQSVCSVDQNGLVTVLAVGTCGVYATNSGDATWASTGTPGVTFQVGKGTQAILTMTSANSVTYGSTISLTASGGSSTGSISYAATGACSVNNYILTVGDVGSSCSVVATKAGDANWYATSSAAQSITVTRAVQATLTVAAASTQAFGTTQLLNYAGGSGDGAVTYAATGACSVNGATLTIGAVGTNCSIIATKAQSTNYLAATSAAFAITATQAAQTVSFTTTASSPTALGSYSVAATATSGLSVAITVDSASASVCSISGATVSFLTGGSCVLNANQTGNTNYTAATQVQQTITVALAAQTITFATPAAMTVTDAATQLSASASSSLQIAFAVGSGTTNTACSINGSGVVTPLAVGTCEITADQSGNATYSAAPRVTRSFSITRANQAALSISSASSVAFGSTINLTTSGGSGTGAVTYSTTGTCTVSGTTLTVGNAGSSCAVTATKAQDANYNATTSAAQTVTVTRVNQATLQIASASTLTYGQTLPLVFTGGSGAGAETWSVDTSVNQNTAGCAVNNLLTNMSVTSTGSCDLVIAKAASTNYNAATSARFSVTVTRASQTVNFTSTIPSSPVSGGTYTLAATATSGLSVSYSLANGSSSYCSLSGNVVTFNATGNCVVNADQAGNSNYTAASTQSQTIAIGSRNQTITFPAIANRTYGDASFTLGASVPSTASVTYALGNGTTNSACSVTSSGIVSVLAVGGCEIVASALGDSQYAPASSVTRAFDVVADRASAPFITSVSAGNGSVTVSFTAPTYTGGAAISGYEINAYRNGILAASSNACAANATSCTITGLTNGYSYTIKMDALNAAGSGIESAASAAVSPYTRPEAVGALAAVAANTAVNLTWQQPSSLGGGTFVSYQIFVRTHGGSYPLNPTATVNSASTTSYALTGLLNGQAYDIKVVTITTAANTQQVSNTAEVQQTPMTVPDAPQQLTIIETLTDGVVDVSWAAPNSDGGSPITGYTVDLGSGHTCSVAGNATTCQIGNLTSATTYNVSAIATNAAGNSLSAGTVITLRVGSATTQTGPPIFTAAFGITVDTVSSFASIDTTDRKRVSTAGGSRIVISGFNLDKVTRVTVDGRPTIIIKKTSAAMLIQLPGSAEEGWADLWFYAPNASLRYVDGIYYATTTIHAVPKPITKIVYGFASVQKSLAGWQKAIAKSAVAKAGTVKSITCVGVAANAKLTCAYVKTLRPGVPVIVKAVKPVKNSITATVVKLTFTR